MRAKPDWQPVQDGVMLYMPAPRQSQISSTVLPTCESEADSKDWDERHSWLRGVAEYGERIVSQDESSDTSAATPSDSTARSTGAGSYEVQGLIDQLLEHAAAYEPGTDTYSKTMSKMPPIRRLDLGKGNKKSRTKGESFGKMSLDNLRDIERSPSHRWDQDERELLCIINRWYHVKHRPTELVTYAKIFNSITGLNIKPLRVRAQFETHITLYGGEAYPEYSRVFATPFEDPHGRYTEIRSLIEDEAKTLGLGLEKRQHEYVRPSGRAKFAKSPETRKIFRSLVRRAAHNKQAETGQVYSTEGYDDWEIITDAETSPVPANIAAPIPGFTTEKPHLTFRVWDIANRTKFVRLGEYFVWADIPNDAILQILDHTDLIQHLNDNPDCRQLLNFEKFEVGSRTKDIAATLRENGLVLNMPTARALGKIAKAFGMGQSGVKAEHLSDLVARLIDGWSITKADFLDRHTMSSLSATFATALGPHADGYTLQEVMASFMQGVDDGTRCMTHWSRSRSGTRRQRFRNA
ncbi:hypothetical protein E8E13_006886 [Curvularia kusanoi]|uniref:Uncharacterized protein n=1 Tax=Curvularia kusanoi TaxID=90978 RepID=A0A9P4TFU5_CURKU|nr:hypothetical protein E8E13_006886 [Curvularia kusanoi]